jgi:aminopeptidase YwaD
MNSFKRFSPIILFVLTAVFAQAVFAQDMRRVRTHLDTLCSPHFAGRGATAEGQKKAALFLADYFAQAGLEPLPNQDGYLQAFQYDINTFPGQMSLKAGRQNLRPGYDYIVQAASPSTKGRYKVVPIDTLLFTDVLLKEKFLTSSLKKSVLIYDEAFFKKLQKQPKEISQKIAKAPAQAILRENKLTMGLSTVQHPTPLLEILKEKYPPNTKKITCRIEASLEKNFEAHNVCAMVKGTAVPDSFIFITAHYDHLGQLGRHTYFPGANDNGSGVSMLMELAAYFKAHPQRYSVVFVAFGAEEPGLIGSHYFTENPLVGLDAIHFLINLDLLGTGDDGMMVVNGSVYTEAFDLLGRINKAQNLLPAIRQRGKAANSDHYFFSEKGVPSFFFYTLGGISAYHDVYDIPATLPLTRYKEVFRLISSFVEQVQP